MKWNRKQSSILIYLAFAAKILLSCSINYDRIPEEERLTTYETLQAYKTPLSVYHYDGQVTDGGLAFFVEVISSKCSDVGGPIKIKLFFQNRTKLPITISSEFNVINGGYSGGGDLSTIIFDNNKRQIYTLADINLGSDIFQAPPSKYSTIPQNAVEEFAIDYYFPEEIIRDKIDEIRSTPSPGQYLIRFVYSDHQRESNNWEGIVSSNLITVCIK